MKKLSIIIFCYVLFVINSNIYAQTNNALDFDGVDDYISTGYLPLANNSFTIEFWAKQDAASLDRYRIVVSQGSATENNGLHIGFRDNNIFTFAFWGNDLDVTTATTDTDWHHWACTYDASTNYRTIYKDGVNVASDVSTSDYSGGAKLYIGFSSFTNDNYWDGQIDEVRVWETERSKADILRTMNLYLNGTETNLLANWRFDEGYDYGVSDLKNTYNGYLQEMTQDDWVVSTIPFGTGVNSTQNGLSTGSWITFGSTGVRIKFTYLGSGDYVSVTKLNSTPNVSPTDLDDLFDSQYWIINNSSSGPAIGDIEFSVAEDITSLDSSNPIWIRLYNRESYSDASWSFNKTADYIDSSNDYATFNSLISKEQFIYGRKSTTVITSLSPTDNAANVVTNTNLTIHFNKDITAGAGNIIIKKKSDNSIVESVAASACSISGTEVTINPVDDFSFQTEYYVVIEATAFKDASNTYFVGYLTNEDWNFTTFEQLQPSSLNPVDNEENFVNDANLVINFNRNVFAGTGNIYIKKYSDDTIVETILASSCSVSGSEVTINPTADLANSTEFFVLIDNTSFKDDYENYFSGYSSKENWNFTTPPEVYVTNLSPASGSFENLPNINLVITFNTAVYAGGGNIYIKKYSDDSLVETIAAASCSISGAETTINPASDLGRNTKYYALIENTAFRDVSSNYFLGYSSKDDWSFKVLDNLRIISIFPQNGSSDLDPAFMTSLSIEFNRNVATCAYHVYFRKSEFSERDLRLCQTINNVVTIFVDDELEYSTQYQVFVGAESFVDEYGEYSEQINWGDWVLTTRNDPNLPVELESFSASTANSKVQLNWRTATEVNNYGFQVQRQKIKDKREDEWEDLGFVQGHGNSNSPKEYSFMDDKPVNGTLHYRLKQIDNNGQFKYSDVVEIEVNNLPTEYLLEQNYPNPFNPSTTIKFGLPENEFVNLSVYNILGEEVARLVNKEMNEGYYEVEFDASKLSSGTYIYSIQTSSGFVSTKKLMVLK